MGKQTESPEGGETGEEEKIKEEEIPASGESLDLTEGGKKDPLLRRQELLVNSGLAEVCCFTIFLSTSYRWNFLIIIYNQLF